MKRHQHFFPLLVLLAILLLPWQSAQAFQGSAPTGNGNVIVGSSYTLKAGETLNDDLVIIGGSASLEAGSTLKGDLVVVGGSASIEKDANLQGSVVVVGGGLTLNNEVRADAVVIGGPANLQPNAHVYGSLVTIGGAIQKSEGARVDGNSIDNTTPPVPPMPTTSSQTSFLFSAMKLFLNALLLSGLAALLALFLPTQMRRVSDTATTQPLMAGGLGILTWVLFVIALIILAALSLFIITLLLTIPILLLVVLTLFCASLFGWLALGAEVGARLIGLTGRQGPLAASAALGVFLLTLLANSMTTIVPCVGWAVPTVISLLGLGAVLITRFGTRLPPTQEISTTASSIPTEISPAADE